MTERNQNDIDRPVVLDNELRRPADGPATEAASTGIDAPRSPAGSGKLTMFAVAVAVVLGAVFYGLNNSSMNPAGTGTTASQSVPAATTTADSNSTPPVAPNVRDVTPRNNAEPGTTTGAAGPRPTTPPADNANAKPAAPTGERTKQ